MLPRNAIPESRQIRQDCTVLLASLFNNRSQIQQKHNTIREAKSQKVERRSSSFPQPRLPDEGRMQMACPYTGAPMGIEKRGMQKWVALALANYMSNSRGINKKG